MVIGGGPAGSTAARHLAGSGIDTLLIERNPSFKKPCGGGMPSSAFKELDLPRRTIKKEIRKIKIFSPGGRTAVIELRDGFVAMVERGEFDSALRDEAKKAGAEVLEAEFKGFTETKGGVVSEVVINGAPATIKSDYAIAGDGVGSKALSSLGLKPPKSIFTLSRRLSGEMDACEFWFGRSHAPGFYSWAFPSASGISVGTGSRNPEDLKSLLQKFMERREVSAPLDEGVDIRGYRMPLWDGSLFNRGRVLFAGDAAGQVMPFTFEGIYYAMKAGSFAAEAVSYGKPEEYEKLWKRRFYARFVFMKRLWSLLGRSDSFMEKLVQLHEKPAVREASQRLWLDKGAAKKDFFSYIRILGEILRRP